MKNYGGLFFFFLMGDFARARERSKFFEQSPWPHILKKKKKTQQSDILWTHPEGFFFFRILSREFSRARERQRKNTPKTPLFEVFFILRSRARENSRLKIRRKKKALGTCP